MAVKIFSSGNTLTVGINVYAINSGLTASVSTETGFTDYIVVEDEFGRFPVVAPYTDIVKANGTTAWGASALATKNALNTLFTDTNPDNYGSATTVSSNTSRITTAETDITELEKAIQVDRSTGGGRGVYYSDSKDTSSSRMTLSDTNVLLQAGSSTKYSISETSPGTHTLSVAAGASGSETRFDAVILEGTTTTNSATFSLQDGTRLGLVKGSYTSLLSTTTLTADRTIQFPNKTGTIALTSDITGISNVVEDTTPQLGGNLDVQSSSITTSTTNGNITLTPNGTGNIVLGTMTLDADQTIGAGQDNYVLTYDNSTGKISLEAAAGGGISNIVEDTTPQLGGNLDLNGNNITGTGNINTTGTLTTSGLATLPGIALGSSGILGTGSITTTSSLSAGSIATGGTLNVTGNATFNANLYAQGVQFTGSGTNTIGPSGIGGPQDDLEIRSNGNVTVVLDYDSNEAAQAFIVKNQAGTTIFQVDEDGITSGLLTTVTPTFSGTQSSYQQGSSASLTISNHISGRTHQGAIYNSSGVEQTTNPVTIDSSGNVSFTAPSTIATGYELRVFSADVGKLRSAEATVTFEITASRNFSYWRLQVVNSSGTKIEDKVYLLEIDFYTGSNATGTVYPTAAVSSTGSGGGATITSGYFHSSTYEDWKAFDNSTGSGWWTLGLTNLAGSNQHLHWIQMELTGGAQTIQSVRVRSNTTYTDADYIQILGSNTGNFTGEEVLCGTLSGIASSDDVTQNI